MENIAQEIVVASLQRMMTMICNHGMAKVEGVSMHGMSMHVVNIVDVVVGNQYRKVKTIQEGEEIMISLGIVLVYVVVVLFGAYDHGVHKDCPFVSVAYCVLY